MTAMESRPAPINPSEAPPPANNVKRYREELGLSKVDLAGLAKLSDKTIARIERQQQRFRTVTYQRVLLGLNRARRQNSLKELSYEDVFPS